MTPAERKLRKKLKALDKKFVADAKRIKEVVIKAPLRFNDNGDGDGTIGGCTIVLGMVCAAHRVVVRHNWRWRREPTKIIIELIATTLTLTDKSLNLKDFSRRAGLIVKGPSRDLDALLRNLSTLEPAAQQGELQ